MKELLTAIRCGIIYRANHYLARMMKSLFLLLTVSVLFSACVFQSEKSDEQLTNKDIDTEAALEEMVQTDQAFSEASSKMGMKKAFLEFIADDAVLLRPGYLPIIEGDVIKFLNNQEDTSFTMTWEPKGADMSAAHDLGFTYGVYKVATKDTTLRGTYLSIWRKQKDGKWKFVLDTGNPGIEMSNE